MEIHGRDITLLVIVKTLLHACIWKIQPEGARRKANTTRGEAECCICLETPPSAVFFIHTSIGSAFSVILYFLVIWLGAIFSSTQNAVIFGDQGISKCSYNLFLVVERTNEAAKASHGFFLLSPPFQTHFM